MVRNKDNPLYPYKQAILCPLCNSVLKGSAPRDKADNHIPRYHCDRNHRYWCLNREKFHTQVYDFIRIVKINPDFIKLFGEVVLDVWKKKKEEEQEDTQYGEVVQELRARKNAIKVAILMVTSTEVVAILEEDLLQVESELRLNIQIRNDREIEEQDIESLVAYAQYFMEHHN